MTVRADPRNPARWLRSAAAGDAVYEESFNPLHVKNGAWFQRVLADRPMNAQNYGDGGFLRRDTGQPQVAVHERMFEGTGEIATVLESQAATDRVTVNNSTGGGTTDIALQVADPAGSGRRVWRFEWDCSVLWAEGAASAEGSGRRRGEFRGAATAGNVLPYDVEIWAITSLRLDQSISWASMTAGDYIHWYQFHDTTFNGSHKPSLAGYICAPRSTRSGDYSDPPGRWFMLHELLDSNEQAIKRWVLPEPPLGVWTYQVFNLRQGGGAPFCKVWHVEAGKAPVLAIDHTGSWGFTDDLGTEYMKCGPYSPGSYLGTVPTRRFWQDGFVQLRAADVPGMTPERMVACLLEQQRY